MATYFNKGTASITTGNTEVTVTHGIDQTPAAEDISVMPCTAWGALTTWWVDTVTSTTFKIKCNLNPLGTVVFAWRVDTRNS